MASFNLGDVVWVDACAYTYLGKVGNKLRLMVHGCTSASILVDPTQVYKAWWT